MDAHRHTVTNFIYNFTLNAASPDVLHQAKRCLLDSLGALLAGGKTPVAQIALRIAQENMQGSPRTSCHVFMGGEVSLVGAALTYGFASNALDIEHGYRPAQGRPGSCLLPVLLPLAQQRPATTGAEFLEALIIGYETAIRAGLMRHRRIKNVFTSGAWALMGAVAAGARLLSLPEQALHNALGAADYHSPLGKIIDGVRTPCMAKDGIGWGAYTAMTSLLLAREGFTAPESFFSQNKKETANLGEEFLFFGQYFKPYCCCRWVHAAIRCALQLMQTHKIQPEEIEHIHVYTFINAAMLSHTPPQNTEQAQYNITYPVASAICHAAMGWEQVLPPQIYDARVLDMQKKITVIVDEEYEKKFPAQTFARVSMTTANKEYTSEAMEPQWEAKAPPCDAELSEKFTALLNPVYGAKKCQKLMHAVWHMEELKDIKTFLQDIRYS